LLLKNKTKGAFIHLDVGIRVVGAALPGFLEGSKVVLMEGRRELGGDEGMELG
jgi:hypothetical protein